MSETTGTARRRLRDHSPQIEAVRRDLEDRVHLTGAEPLLDFASIFLGRASDAFLQGRSSRDLANLTLGAFRFLESSRPDRVDVAALNPTPDDEGWSARLTVVRTSVSERPFIVDTIREFLHGQGLAIEHMVYPLLDVERAADGRIVAVRAPSDAGSKESLVHCEIERVSDPETLDFLVAELKRRLQDVVRATDDFRPMLAVVDEVAADLTRRAEALASVPAGRDAERRDELAEVVGFLLWLSDGGFVFLGYRGYDLVDGPGGERAVVVEPGSGLGVLRNEGDSRFAEPVPLTGLPEAMRAIAERGPLLVITKTNAEATVHRRARMDYIGLKKLDAQGRTVGEHRFLGLFTSKAYSEAAENIPILRRKLAHVLAAAGVRRGSHDHKAIITIFNSLPRAELFGSSIEEIGEDVQTVLTSFSTDDVRVSLREDPLGRGLSVMVILPRERFSSEVRKELEAALVEAFTGEVLSYHLALGEGDQARLHFLLAATDGGLRKVEPADLERTVAQLIRTWTDLVEEGLGRTLPADVARELAREYGDAMSLEYQAATDPEAAVGDIAELESMAAESRAVSIALANRLSAPVAGVDGATELKLFLRGERLVLSDFMPILDNLGLRVVAMKPYEVRENGSPRATIYVFAVQNREGRPIDIESRGALLSETLLAARAGDVVSDPLNALVVGAGLHWREVDVLRGLTGYAFQAGLVPSRAALPAALVKYPGIARELFDLFATKFDPATRATTEERLAAAADISTAFQASLRGVGLLADDRALRRLEQLICSAVRTNYYRRGGRTPSLRSGGVPFVSFKILVGDLARPRPTELLFEVCVHSSRMEGVHLRGSTVARGGIRWSDRPDDFRKEVLGLVKTQMVKNAVIVPGGSKGGFIPRRVPQDAEARLEEGEEQYRTLIRGLLDLTDNLEGGRHVAPEGIVAYDPPDPYLVVAADKGTATFSDIANAVAAEYGFWLGDAFASGGSHGYDHKAVAITARGAWECVQRHFREMGKDIQSEPFTVVGIGDMSGDVFGNGMLLSEQIRLVAAFDHRHVFIDPDPDPAVSHAERARLFALGRSSWDDYDRRALSKGGLIVPRAAKEVELTPEAARSLGLAERRGPLDGESLVRQVLTAPVELHWNGGIGTYVKASSESHADAGDPTNDSVRVSASELRCAVVGEGGNLGFTQRARVEYALAGGRINTDALDNSGGVDMSDHEVNLKILLAPAVASGKMSSKRRDKVLEDLTDAVAALVLQDNRTQSLAISLDEQRAQASTDDFRDLMFALEKAGDLDRASAGLPSRDVLVERKEVGQSLVRPELCVLLSYAKLGLKTELLKSSLPDDPVTESYLVGYFPPAAAVAAGRANLSEHRLRREIIASQLTNDLVDLMGSAFVQRVTRDTGATTEQVVRAWLVASRLAEHRSLMGQLAEQRAIDALLTYRWLLGLGRVLERTTRWVLRNVEPEASPALIVARHLEGLAELRNSFARFVVGDEKDLFEARVREIQEVGADEMFSRRLITLRFLDQLLEILEIARATGAEPVATAHAFYAASKLFDVPWLRRRTFAAAVQGQWEQRASQAVSEDLSRAHRRLVIGVVGDPRGVGDEPGEADYAARLRARDIERFRGIVAELKADDAAGLAALSVAVRELSALADRIGRLAGEERRR
jgi:glutamate dehydrogenase